MLQLREAFEEFGNPFLDNSSDLMSFGTNPLSSKEQIKCLYKIKVAGKQQFKGYWNETVVNNTSAISDTVKNNKFEMFSTSKSKNPSKLHQKLKLVKNNVGLLSCHFIVSQARNGDLDTFLAQENQETSPSLSENW